jgi:hypothetical protein
MSDKIFLKMFAEYTEFSKKTLNGKLGKTAQFSMEYIQRVSLYHLLERAVHEGILDLYIQVLSEFTDLFFVTNRQNYARWMAKHQLDLLNMPMSHPGLKVQLCEGLFSIRRTNNQSCSH